MSLDRLKDALNNYQILCKSCIGIQNTETISFSTPNSEILKLTSNLNNKDELVKIKNQELTFDVDFTEIEASKKHQSRNEKEPQHSHLLNSPINFEGTSSIKSTKVKFPKREMKANLKRKYTFIHYTFIILLLIIIVCIGLFIFNNLIYHL